MSLLGNPEAELWLSQFSPTEMATARRIAGHFTFVSASEFSRGMTVLMNDVSSTDKVAFFVEREISKRWVRVDSTVPVPSVGADGKRKFTLKRFTSKRLQPIKMYKEIQVFRAKGLPKKVSASGAALAPVDSIRRDSQSVGSEGVVATIASGVCNQSQGRFTLHPSADLVRKNRVHRFVVITDFIGSGTRIRNTIDSLWRVGSVRSWFNGSKLRISVLAFSGTHQGVNHVKTHPTKPSVTLLRECPTIKNSFSGKERTAVEELCKSRAPSEKFPLGYGDVGALIAFEHSCPNNVPAIFVHESQSRAKPWKALFPKRGTAALSSSETDVTQRDRERFALQTLRFPNIAEASSFIRSNAKQRAVIVALAALQRGHRNLDSLTTVTSFSLRELSSSIAEAKLRGLLDDRQRLTEQGFALLRNLNRKKRNRQTPATPEKSGYYPQSLRVPFL